MAIGISHPPRAGLGVLCLLSHICIHNVPQVKFFSFFSRTKGNLFCLPQTSLSGLGAFFVSRRLDSGLEPFLPTQVFLGSALQWVSGVHLKSTTVAHA